MPHQFDLKVLNRMMDRRARILASGTKLFMSKGFDDTSVDAIAAKSRVSKGDFYALFRDKQELFLEISQQLMWPPNRRYRLIDGSLQEQFAEFAYRSRLAQLEQPGIGLLRAAIVAMRIAPDVGRQVYQTRSRFADSFLGFVTDLAHRGVLLVDDPALAVHRFGALAMDGLRYLVGTPLPDESSRRRDANNVAQVFLGGHATELLRRNPDVIYRLVERCEPVEQTPISCSSPMPATRISSERWDTVLDLAWEEFRDNPYNKASIEAVSIKSSLPRNTIYRRYRSKAGIFEWSCRRMIDQNFRENLIPEYTSAPLFSILTDVAHNIQRNFCSKDIIQLQRMLVVESSRNPQLCLSVYQYFSDSVESRIRTLFDQLVLSGLIRDPGKGRIERHFFLLATFGSRFLFIDPGCHDDERRLAAEAVTQFLFGSQRATDMVKLTGSG